MAGLLIVPGLWPVFDANGDPVSGATIRLYEPGTTTPKAVYSDATLATSLGTVLTTNASGEPTTLAAAVARLWWAADAAAFDVQVVAGAATRTWSNVVVSDSGVASLLPVSTITALRAATWPSSRPTQVQVVSNWVTGDGGGVFRWDAASVVTENGGTIVKETATATGRWIRQFIGAVQVSWFGTDSTAYDAALAYATSLNLPLEGPTLVNGQSGNLVPAADSLPNVNPITLQWAAAQFLASGATTLLTPQIVIGGEGDEGVHTITMDGIKTGWDTIGSLVLGTAVAYDAAGSAVTISAVTTAPPTVTFSTTGSAGARRQLFRAAGTTRITRRALGVRVAISLEHGSLAATDQQITVTAKLNGTVVGTIAAEEPVSSLAVTSGEFILTTAKAGDALTFEVNQSNGSGSVLGVQVGSEIIISPISVLTVQRDPAIFGLQQGAALTDADIPALAQMDEFYVSGMWSGNIASSNTMAHGQKFFDGFVSSKHSGIETRLKTARATRSILANPNGPLHLAYMAATVAAPDGTLAGQAFYDRFASPTPGQTVFTASRDVLFVPSGGQYSCGSWVQQVKIAGQYQIGYGLLYNLISAGTYQATTTVLGITMTLTWSGAGARTLTIVTSSPLVSGDYFAIAHATNRKIDPWSITDVGRQNLREMVGITFQGFQAKIDGIFLDLCNTQFIAKEDFWEVVRILRPFAPAGKMTFNALYPSVEAIEFIANCPSVMAGDTILIEGAGCSVGVDSSTNTLLAVGERNRISANGKHLHLAWLATIAQATSGPVESNAAILTARTSFLANSKLGDKFACHWTGLGTPYNSAARPLPPRISGITQWS